ncbi:MAG: TetR family transcriptional regulator [Micropruina sp.]|uniref:TetR/AcrR family transcriptional regulator n=1 Tax=Micropruina sp. TaxID=2737536 RepID=UPI0039E2DB95
MKPQAAERSPNADRRRRGPYAKSARRRREIVDAAFEVFAARGYQGGSLQEVADRIGLSQTGILHYFPSKRDLLIAVLAKRDQMAEVSPSDDGASPGLVAEVLDQARHNESVPGLIELYTVLCGESVTETYPDREYFVDRFRRLRASYARKLRELAAQGRVRDDVDIDRAAASLVALWDGIQAQWLLDREGTDVVGCLRDYLDSILVPAG